MGKRKKIKRSFPRRMGADNVRVSSGADQERIATYFKRVMSGHGPKHQREPMLDHTFNRIIHNGQVLVVRCTCGVHRTFNTQEEFDVHVETQKIKNPRGKGYILDPDRRDNHIPNYIPEVTHTKPQLKIEETYNVYDKKGELVRIEVHEHPLAARKTREYELWQSTRRQGFTIWHWSTLYSEGDKLLIRLGMCGEVFKFRKIYPTHFIESLTYSSRAAAEAAFDSVTIRWFKKEHELTEL